MYNLITLAMNQAKERAEKIAVVVKTEDLQNGNARFYAFRENMLYSPYNGYKPDTDFQTYMGVSGGHKLPDSAIDNYNALLMGAHTRFNELKEEFNQNSNSGNNQEVVKRLMAEIETKNAKQAEQLGIISEHEQTIARLSAQTRNVSSNSPELNMTRQLEKLLGQTMDGLKGLKDVYPQKHIIKIGDFETVIEGAVHEKFDKILRYLVAKRNVYLHGPSGTGKSHIGKQIAKAMGLKFYFTNAVQQAYDLTGFLDANNRYVETEFYKAFVYGGVFMLDELDASVPEALITLNSALAQKHFNFPTGKKEAHENFRVIASGNTIGNGGDNQFNARYQIDKATMDRFDFIKIYYSEAIENSITNGNQELLAFMRDLRKTAENSDIQLFVTYRSLEGIAVMEELEELDEVLDSVLVKGMDKEDLRMLARNLTVSADNKYFKAFKKLA
jgi:cobaltochelatase CobS